MIFAGIQNAFNRIFLEESPDISRQLRPGEQNDAEMRLSKKQKAQTIAQQYTQWCNGFWGAPMLEKVDFVHKCLLQAVL